MASSTSPLTPGPCRSAAARRRARRGRRRSRRRADDPGRRGGELGDDGADLVDHRLPSTPGGSVPRAISATCRRRARRRPAGLEQPLADAPPAERVELDRERVLDLVGERADADPEPLAQERPHRVLDEPTRSSSSTTVSGRAAAGRQERPAGRRGRARACAPASASGQSSRARPAARPVKLRGSNGCSGWRITTCSRAGPPRSGRCVDDVQQLADGNGRRAAHVGALVVAGVGDDQPVGRGQQRVEQELAVLAARVALADQRVVEHQVVAVAAGCAGTPRRRARAGRRPGGARSASASSVHTVRWPVRKLARVGRPRRRCASSARTSAGASSGRGRPRRLPRPSRRARAEARPAARARVAGRGQRVGGIGDRLGPGERLADAQRVDRRPVRVPSARQSGRPDRSSGCRRRRAAAPRRTAAVVLGHRHPQEKPVKPHRQVRWPGASRYGARWGASSPQRIPLSGPSPGSASYRRRRSRSDGGPARGRRGRGPATRSCARGQLQQRRPRPAPGWSAAASGRPGGPGDRADARRHRASSLVVFRRRRRVARPRTSPGSAARTSRCPGT